MKAFTTVLFFVAIGACLASSAIHQSLVEIDKDPFGSTLLSAISLNLKAKTPFSEVQDLLQGIQDDLLADHEFLRTDFETRSSNLNEAINDGVSLIDSYDIAIQGLRDSIESDTETRGTKSTTLGNTRDALAFEEQRLRTLEEDYQATVPVADADIVDLQGAVQAINNALTKMESYQSTAVGSSSFLELASSTQKDMKKVTDTMQKMKKTLSKRSNLYTPLVRELLDLTTNMEQTRSERVVSLLQQLLELIRQSLSDVQTARAAFIARYNSEKEAAEGNVITYTGQIAQLEEDIRNLDTRIAQAQGDLALTTDLRQAAQEKLDADRASLQAATDYFNDQDPRYQRTIDLVRRVIEHFNANVAAVDEYTAGRLEGTGF